MGLQGAELILIGYNTPVHNPPAPEHDRLGDFHNHLVMQSGAYQNGTWVVGVAKAGDEEGVPMIGGSAIIAPTGEIVGRCVTEGDELNVDYRAAEPGATVEFGTVLLYSNGDDLKIGQPGVAGAKVVAEVVDETSVKLRIGHFRRRKNYKRVKGHRQWYTRVRVKSIVAG